MSVVASLVVSFGDGADSSANVVIEPDAELNKDSEGNERTTFYANDVFNFRIHHDPTVRIAEVKATHGMVQKGGEALRSIIQQSLFSILSDSHELSCIPSGGLSAKWYGNVAVGLKKSGARGVIISGGELPALCDVSYSAPFKLYRLHTPAVSLKEGESYPITIVAHMEAA